MDLIIITTCLIVCFFTGSIVEKKHFKKLREREIKLYKSPCISFGKAFSKNTKIQECYLVSSSVVIACDYFKHFLASLKTIFGGNISSYESVLDRGRREAILRIREYAKSKNANAIINIKIDTILIDPPGGKQNPKVCVTAYGTARKYDG